MGHVTPFRNFDPPISRERLELEPSNLAWTLTIRSSIDKMQNFVNWGYEESRMPLL